MGLKPLIVSLRTASKGKEFQSGMVFGEKVDWQ